MPEQRETSPNAIVKQEVDAEEIVADTSAQDQPAGSFYVSTRYDINQHFHDEQVEWIEANLEVFEQAVLAGRHFLWLEPFFEAWFQRWPENEDGMYCAAEEADDIVDRKKNILRILTMRLEARWNRLWGDEEDPQSIVIKLGILEYLHEFLDRDFN
ncbi:hypothetical protein ARMSODRAFT_1027153 [Armillaria solidipes]|uniref:Uncharacterized protein n=1 Tax=Armillaria solidipes TaxID=1076256 RepID=A0A2H3ALH0_9AGAR|nr:hypothetical protein ARMSODRAFT_1027153 [Armillaria solidipes]